MLRGLFSFYGLRSLRQLSRLRGWPDPALGSPLPFFPSSFASL